MISLRRLGFRYDPRGPWVLRDVTLEVARGATLLLAGANGGGKSTLLALLAGLLTPSEGEASVHGVATPGEEATLRRRTGLVFQEADLQILGATAREDLLLGVDRDDAAGAETRLELARGLGLGEVLDAPVQELSYGQKRKLCLAETLSRDPMLVLLDEPLSGLDYPAVVELRKVLAANREAGLTQIVASHDLEPLVDLCDALAVLNGGTLALHGPPENVLDKAADHGVRPPCSWRREGKVTPWE